MMIQWLMVISDTQTHLDKGRLQKAGGGTVLVKVVMGTSLCMESYGDQLTLCLVLARCLPTPNPSFCEVLCRLVERSELDSEAGLARKAQCSRHQSLPLHPTTTLGAARSKSWDPWLAGPDRDTCFTENNKTKYGLGWSTFWLLKRLLQMSIFFFFFFKM